MGGHAFAYLRRVFLVSAVGQQVITRMLNIPLRIFESFYSVDLCEAHILKYFNLSILNRAFVGVNEAKGEQGRCG